MQGKETTWKLKPSSEPQEKSCIGYLFDKVTGSQPTDGERYTGTRGGVLEELCRMPSNKRMGKEVCSGIEPLVYPRTIT